MKETPKNSKKYEKLRNLLNHPRMSNKKFFGYPFLESFTFLEKYFTWGIKNKIFFHVHKAILMYAMYIYTNYDFEIHFYMWYNNPYLT